MCPCLAACVWCWHSCLDTDTTHPHLLKMSTTPDTPCTKKRKCLKKYRREWQKAHPLLDSVSGDDYETNRKMYRQVFSMVWNQTVCIRRATQQTQKNAEGPSVSVTVFHTSIISWDWYGKQHYVIHSFSTTYTVRGRGFYLVVLLPEHVSAWAQLVLVDNLVWLIV